MKITIVQPYLTNYRIPVFDEISDTEDVTVYSSKTSEFGVINSDYNFNSVLLDECSFVKGRFFIQFGLVGNFLRNVPDVLFISANPRYISSLFLCVLAKFFGVKVFLHGQGLFKKKKVGFLDKFIYGVFNLLCDRYVCYTEFSKQSLVGLPIFNKSSVCENSIINRFSLNREFSGETGILFVGRLRDGCNVEFLINAAKEYPAITFHIVGSGPSIQEYRILAAATGNVTFYGELYDQKQIAEVSRKCFVGCYPGDAGLSVLHYMSLSLPVVVHSDIQNHMGPEPSYVIDGYNGIMFERNSFESFLSVIERIVEAEDSRKNEMMVAAFETYNRINTPTLGRRLLNTFSEVLGEEIQNT